MPPRPALALNNALKQAGLKAVTMRYAVVIEQAEGNFSAYVPELPGCVATGVTLADAEREIRAPIAFHVEGLRADGLPLPEAASVVEYVGIGDPSRRT